MPAAKSPPPPAALPPHPWVHVTSVANRDAVLADGLKNGYSRGTPGNYNTNPRAIFLGDGDADPRRWAKEIANRLGEETTFAVFGVSLIGYGRAFIVGRTTFGPQVVVTDWNIPADNLVLLGEITVKPRAGAKFDFP